LGTFKQKIFESIENAARNLLEKVKGRELLHTELKDEERQKLTP
jgi:hypothetical protein